MSNTYTFSYHSDASDDDDGSPFPSETHITTTHEVDSGQAWDVVLWQFCKFLEHTGYEGVRERVKLDMIKTNDWLFESCYEGRDNDIFFGEDLSEDTDISAYIEALDNTDKDAQ